MPEIACDHCGELHQRYPSRIKDGPMFCSVDCANEYKRRDGEWMICDWCGDDTYISPSRLDNEHYFCDRDCSSKWRSEAFSGDGHPQWDGGGVTLECEECGSKYKRIRALADTSRFCSRACKQSDWADEPVTRECHVCGESVTRKPIDFKGERCFCSKECFSSWQSGIKRGSGNPAWKGGKGLVDATRSALGKQSWNRIAKQKRESVSHECEKCGETPSARKLDVHHIIPVATGGTNESWNLMALCSSCHKTVEHFTDEYTESHIFPMF